MEKLFRIFSVTGFLILIGGFISINIANSTQSFSANPDDEDWSGVLIFSGEANTTFTSELTWQSTYNIFVTEDSNVSVEIIDGDSRNFFDRCEKCDDFDVDGRIDGFSYIGELAIEDDGTYNVKFTIEDGESAEIMVREDSDFIPFILAAGGILGICCGTLLIVLGLILNLLKKGKNNQNDTTPQVVMVRG